MPKFQCNCFSNVNFTDDFPPNFMNTNYILILTGKGEVDRKRKIERGWRDGNREREREKGR